MSLFVYLSHMFLATCKKQDVTFIFVERKTRQWVFSNFVVDWSCIYLFIFGAIAIKICDHFRILVISNLNFIFQDFSIYPCKVGVSPFYVTGDMCKW